MRASVAGDRLWEAWCERVRADARLDAEARALVEADDGEAPVVAAETLSRAHAVDGSSSAGSASPAPALAEAADIGRRASEVDVDLAALQRLFAHLHDVLFVELLREPAPSEAGSGEPLTRAQAERCARRANAAIRSAAGAAGEAWFEAFGRTLRHDIKTPLQAASLNLELLMLESEEKGLDTAALETIQQSLDQAVEMLRRFERVEG